MAEQTLEQRAAKNLRRLADGLDSGGFVVAPDGYGVNGIWNEAGDSIIGRTFVFPLMYTGETPKVVGHE